MGGPREAPEPNFEDEVSIDPDSGFDPPLVALRIAERVFGFFGIKAEAIPYTEETGSGKRIVSKSKIAGG